MKKTSYLLLCILLLAGCQTKEEKLKKKIEPLLKNYLLEENKGSKIDSLNIYKIENLTQKSHARIIYHPTYNYVKKISKVSYGYKDLYNQADEGARLYGGDFVNKRKDFYDSAAKYNIVVTKGLKILDSLSYLSAKGDTANTFGYIISYNYKTSNAANVQKGEDSMTTIITTDFKIIPLGTFFKKEYEELRN